MKNTNTKTLTRVALLVAIELVMKLVGLGSVPVGPLYMSLCAGFVVDILIVLLERVVSGRVPKRECRYRSPGKRMPADRRATVSTRLTAMLVSSMRAHSSWSPAVMAR